MHSLSNTAKNEILSFNEMFKLNEQDIIKILLKEKGWESRYRRIMMFGKQLPTISSELKQEQALVQGCESPVWFNHYWHDECLILAANSDSKIVKGLITIVIAAYNNKTINEIQRFDIEKYFSQLKLTHNLSPSRTNGLYAMVKRIHLIIEDKD